MGESNRSADTRGHFENYRAALNEAKLPPLNGRNRHLMFSRCKRNVVDVGTYE